MPPRLAGSVTKLLQRANGLRLSRVWVNHLLIKAFPPSQVAVKRALERKPSGRFGRGSYFSSLNRTERSNSNPAAGMLSPNAASASGFNSPTEPNLVPRPDTDADLPSANAQCSWGAVRGSIPVRVLSAAARYILASVKEV